VFARSSIQALDYALSLFFFNLGQISFLCWRRPVFLSLSVTSLQKESLFGRSLARGFDRYFDQLINVNLFFILRLGFFTVNDLLFLKASIRSVRILILIFCNTLQVTLSRYKDLLNDCIYFAIQLVDMIFRSVFFSSRTQKLQKLGQVSAEELVRLIATASPNSSIKINFEHRLIKLK
jgi:hypothetical protein